MDTIALTIGGFVILLVVAVTAAIARMNNGVKTINPTHGLPSQSTQTLSTLASSSPDSPRPPLILPPNFEQEIQRLISSGQLMEAIKLCRDVTGGDLRRAKEIVESMDTSRFSISTTVTERVEENAALNQQVKTFWDSGHKIEAIKLYRETYRTDLKAAKEAVERMVR